MRLSSVDWRAREALPVRRLAVSLESGRSSQRRRAERNPDADRSAAAVSVLPYSSALDTDAQLAQIGGNTSMLTVAPAVPQ